MQGLRKVGRANHQKHLFDETFADEITSKHKRYEKEEYFFS